MSTRRCEHLDFVYRDRCQAYTPTNDLSLCERHARITQALREYPPPPLPELRPRRKPWWKRLRSKPSDDRTNP